MEHHLKTLPEYFEAVASGRKTFEARRDDRPFAEGDTLLLEEWDGSRYTGRTVRVAVAYVLRGEYCRDGYCIMGVKLDGANGDRIRAMSDESLADRLVRYEGTDIEPTRFGGHHHHFYGPDEAECKNRNDAVKAWVDWLKQPAEEG